MSLAHRHNNICSSGVPLVTYAISLAIRHALETKSASHLCQVTFKVVDVVSHLLFKGFMTVKQPRKSRPQTAQRQNCKTRRAVLSGMKVTGSPHHLEVLSVLHGIIRPEGVHEHQFRYCLQPVLPSCTCSGGISMPTFLTPCSVRYVAVISTTGVPH
jgi:hypothetical protein